MNVPELRAHKGTYEETRILFSIICKEPLDIVKSLPKFEGKIESYILWWPAGHTAYKIFEKCDRSSKHYHAVAIIRNKIMDSPNALLASFNTPFNFYALIDRLGFKYTDKRPIYLIE